MLTTACIRAMNILFALSLCLGFGFTPVRQPPAASAAALAETHTTYLPFISKIDPEPPFLNGGFEAGPVEWKQYSQHNVPQILSVNDLLIPPRNGRWMGSIGGHVDDVSYLERSFYVPQAKPRLIFWVKSYSYDRCDYYDDFAYIYIDGVQRSSYELCFTGNTIPWTKDEFWFPGGTTHTIKIVVENNATNLSYFFVDDFEFVEDPF